MNVGVTGHRQREGIEWSWVAQVLRAELAKLTGIRKAFSSLAAGTDQVFADVALELGLPVTAVLPINAYERFFDAEGLAEYHRLLPLCKLIQLRGSGYLEQGFFEAGKFIVDHSDLLIAVWDGAPARGQGGTADVVAYARKRSCPVAHIHPFNRTVGTIYSGVK
jgi:hypothetical protein